MEWYIIGIMATLLTAFGFIPQIIKIYKSKSVKDVSIGTLFQFSFGVILWILYGTHINDRIIIIANVITLMTLIVAIVLYYHYNKI